MSRTVRRYPWRMGVGRIPEEECPVPRGRFIRDGKCFTWGPMTEGWQVFGDRAVRDWDDCGDCGLSSGKARRLADRNRLQADLAMLREDYSPS